MAGALIKEMGLTGTFSGKIRLSAFILVIRLPDIYFSADAMAVVFLPACLCLCFSLPLPSVRLSGVPGAGVVAEFRAPPRWL